LRNAYKVDIYSTEKRVIHRDETILCTFVFFSSLLFIDIVCCCLVG